MLVDSRNAAKAQGHKRYFTGRPCGRGHTTERYSADGMCVACHLLARRAQRAKYPERETEYRHKWRSNNPKRVIFMVKQTNARAHGIPFGLVFADMVFPEYCPVLGIKLDYSVDNKRSIALNSPSFDRLNSSSGYTAENVIIVSAHANALRKDHSVEAMRDLAPRSPNHTKVYKFYSTLFSSLQKQPECT